MDNSEIKVRVTLKLDEKWASNLSREELIEFIKVKLENSLGFRGRVEEVKVPGRK